MNELGKLLIFVGGLLAAAGLLILLPGRTNLPLGRLPGDIFYRGKHTTFYFPLLSCLLLSLILSLVMYAVNHWRK